MHRFSPVSAGIKGKVLALQRVKFECHRISALTFTGYGVAELARNLRSLIDKGKRSAKVEPVLESFPSGETQGQRDGIAAPYGAMGDPVTMARLVVHRRRSRPLKGLKATRARSPFPTSSPLIFMSQNVKRDVSPCIGDYIATGRDVAVRERDRSPR